MNQAAEYITDYIFEQVLLESERLKAPVELKNVTTDFEVFEHLDKPYLTATLMFVDSENVYTDADILGGETITVTLKSTQDTATAITKRFYIQSIATVDKVNENIQSILLTLIEDIAYISNLYNINKSYTGTPSEIIEKINKNYLGREFISTQNDKNFIKTIIPNLDPIEAMSWLKNRATTIDGYPFYLYTTFTDNNLRFVDLGSLLLQPVINKDVPYRAWEATSKSMYPDIQRRIIKSYELRNIENLFDLIQKGLIGAQYEFVDTLLNQRRTFDFDVVKDLYNPLLTKQIIPENQRNPMYSPEYKHNEISFNEYKSRTITNIGTSSPYKNPSNNFLAYGENANEAEYKRQIISSAMDSVMKKSPLTVILNGLDFIEGGFQSTIGRNIRFEFLNSKPDHPIYDVIDKKKSGDYLIFATRHIFKKESYHVSMSCVKMGNYKR